MRFMQIAQTGPLLGHFQVAKGTVQAPTAQLYFSAMNTVDDLLVFAKPCAGENVLLAVFHKVWEHLQGSLTPSSFLVLAFSMEDTWRSYERLPFAALFVGLLLVTRLLPHGSDDGVRRVLEALGTQFLHRLLLPLRRPSQEPLSVEAAEHQSTSCSLALAILAAACRLNDFAAGPDVRELLPVLLKVVQYGGVSRALQAGTAAAAASAGAAAADAAAVSDALECLVGAAAAAPELTLSCLERLPVMDALAAWLTAAAAVLTAAGGGSAAGAASPAAEAQAHNSVLLAAVLLECMLTGAAEGRATAVLAEHPTAAAQVMAALSALVGNPRLLLPATHGAPPPASPPPQQQHRPQAPGAAASSQAASDSRKGSGSLGSSRSGGSGGGVAQLQLEALHLLLLMLQSCQESAAAATAHELLRLDEHVAWSAAVRRGLGWLLRSRAPGALKHSALQLGALVVQLVGEGWLLGPRPFVSGVAVQELEEPPGSFLLLLLETLKRLLEELAARAAQRKAAEEAAVQAAAGAATGAAALPAAAAAAAAPAADVDMSDGSLSKEVRGGGASAAGPAVPPPATIPAGRRALLLLPACFRLLEGSVEAVAADAGDCMEVEVSEPVAAAPHSAGTRGMVPQPPPRPRPPVPAQPVLPDAVVQKLMGAFDGIADTLLQFFEADNEVRQQQQQQQGAPSPSGEVLLGAARVLGRYLAEAPGAVRNPRVLRGLPLVVAVRCRAGAAEAAPRAVPVDKGVCTQGQQQQQQQQQQRQEEEDGEEGEDLDGFSLPFLLPGLLQATGPDASERSEVARALRTSPEALSACVSYLAHCVRSAVAAAPNAERLLAAAGAAVDGAAGTRGAAALSVLAQSEQGMADVSMLLLNLLEPSVLGAVAARLGDEGDEGSSAGAAPPPSAWYGISGAGSADAADAASRHLPPLLAQLLPVCWLVQHWAASRMGALGALASLDPLRLPIGRGAPTAADLLFRFQLATRTLLCTTCLAAVVLTTVMSWLAAGAQQRVLPGTVAHHHDHHHHHHGHQQQEEDGKGSAAELLSVLLPSAVVEAVGTATLAAAAAGTSLQMAQLHDLAKEAPPPPPPPPAALRDPRLPLTAAGLAEDFLGDGEVCWERLLGAAAQMVEMSTAVQQLVAAGLTAAEGEGSAVWLQRLVAARARGEGAAEELLMSEVNLALFLQVVVQGLRMGGNVAMG
ncbi:hypothetical protein VOLCADRAFT_106633 [Volvox carteri f. nagariensis]|uniref:Uncharacterized protein n=1 Tax=Volvox carteri f. nagariensis TaxID=3068 RepID=D8U8R5_VOLCA|nr:uncharacterized protein VOLCADRAFT_106633 [Volvox carteri f. nagariensis]EFJ43796.1 hypothetical protein VOLCADRAFT_106633 [Volvox carteri f. nagariensis]|eukprot:XP_002955042.1 hypothetical protein VOLCADRAFT_106633 [Volvox carteri f. nagariensis]